MEKVPMPFFFFVLLINCSVKLGLKAKVEELN